MKRDNKKEPPLFKSKEGGGDMTTLKETNINK